jgi:hypothetical protein
MRIDGLTAQQVQILDELWACDTIEDMQIYLESKTTEEIEEVITLREMIFLSGVDEDVEAMDVYPEAEQMLASILK